MHFDQDHDQHLPAAAERRLLVFGGNGFVGAHLVQAAARAGWTAWVAERHPDGLFDPAREQAVDITDREAVERVIAAVRPAAVVNTAAIADIDLAEREPALAQRINADGPAFIAQACARQGARFIHFSSDAVFDGRGGPYREEDPPAPVNHYGRTKAAGEQAVLAAWPNSLVLRVSLILGFPLGEGNAFLVGLERRLRAGETVNAVVEEERSPIDVLTLAESVTKLLDWPLTGLLHLGSTGKANRLELGQAAAAALGYPTDRILPVHAAAASPGRAPRHLSGVLAVSKAQSLGLAMPDLPHTLARAFSTRPAELTAGGSA